MLHVIHRPSHLKSFNCCYHPVLQLLAGHSYATEERSHSQWPNSFQVLRPVRSLCGCEDCSTGGRSGLHKRYICLISAFSFALSGRVGLLICSIFNFEVYIKSLHYLWTFTTCTSCTPCHIYEQDFDFINTAVNVIERACAQDSNTRSYY